MAQRLLGQFALEGVVMTLFFKKALRAELIINGFTLLEVIRACGRSRLLKFKAG